MATPAFLAAIGGSPDTFVSFAVDRFGALVVPGPSNEVEGDIFSDDVVFSTLSGPVNPLGTSQVSSVVGSGMDEIGPFPGFTGPFEISFFKGGCSATV